MTGSSTLVQEKILLALWSNNIIYIQHNDTHLFFMVNDATNWGDLPKLHYKNSSCPTGMIALHRHTIKKRTHSTKSGSYHHMSLCQWNQPIVVMLRLELETLFVVYLHLLEHHHCNLHFVCSRGAQKRYSWQIQIFGQGSCNFSTVILKLVQIMWAILCCQKFQELGEVEHHDNYVQNKCTQLQ